MKIVGNNNKAPIELAVRAADIRAPSMSQEEAFVHRMERGVGRSFIKSTLPVGLLEIPADTNLIVASINVTMAIGSGYDCFI